MLDPDYLKRARWACALLEPLAQSVVTALLDEIDELKSRLAVIEHQLHHTSPSEEAQDLSKCPSCGGPADHGHDREFPPNVYACSKCSQELAGQGIAFAYD